MKALLSALLLLLAVSACRHPIEIVGDGDVMSASGNRDCLLEDYQARLANCVDNDVAGAYQETYYAVPRAGWQFGGWGHYCAPNSGSGGCNFKFSAEQVEEHADESMPSLVAYFRREIKTAHKAVLMGHSFFDPIASNMEQYFHSAGFEEHTQKSFYSGGGGGAPISFWDNGGDNNTAIKKALDEGGNTLLGMTYYPMPDVDRNLQGFRNWVEYARNKNPAITVFLSVAWPQNPSALELKQYREPWKSTYHEEIHAFTDALRKEFPDNKFYCIPYGLAAIELKKLFEAGALPEINALVGDYNTAVFSDDQGHANAILVELASLMWLRAIYGTDLLSSQYSSNYSTDLRVLAQMLLARHDHRYSAP